MKENNLLERLNKNYDELEDNKKEVLLKVGEQLLGIQNLVNDEGDKKDKKHIG